MPISQLTVTSVGGIEIQSNSFTAADGTFQRAKNVVVKYKNRLQKRRGNNLLTAAASIPASSSLIPFKNDLFVAYSNILGLVDPTTGSVSNLSGAVAVGTDSRVRYAEASDNLYMATTAAIRKLQSSAVAIVDAGLPSALDLATVLTNTTGGFMGPGQVAYQITFVRTDSNGNLLESAPSEYSYLVNPPFSGATAAVSAGAVTITVSGGHGLITGQVYSLVVGSSSVPASLQPGTYFATAATGTTLTFTVGSATTTGITGDFTVFRNTSLNFTIPAGYTVADSVRIYRTDLASSILVPATTGADPTTMQLVSQTTLTAGTTMTVADSTPDALKGSFLYTNPDRDGAAGANFPPPFARDLALFRDSVFYANTSQFYSQSLDLINTQSPPLTNNTSSITVVKNLALPITTITGSASTWVLTGAGIGGSFSVGDYVYVDSSAISGNNGLFPITAKTTNSLTVTNASGATGTTASAYFTRRYLATSTENFTQTYGGDFQLTTTTSSVFTPITNTARSLLRAMNRDARGLVYGSYVSTPDGAPGEMTINSRNFTDQFFLLVNSTTTGSAFSPVLPTSGKSILADDEARANRMYYSKQSQPEAVPLVNFMDIGPRTASILRIIPLRDTLVVITTKGVYRVVGTNPLDFQAFSLDLTTNCSAADSVVAMNNLVYMLTNQGIVAVSDSSASVVSTPIEPLLQATSSNANLSLQTNAAAYESERLYLISTISPKSNVADTVYCLNLFTNAWTTWDTVFNDAIVNPADDTLYVLSTTGDLNKERKLNNNLDFSDRSYTITLAKSSVDGLTCTFTGQTPQVGWAIYQGSTLGRISAVNGNTVTFAYPVQFIIGPALLYSSIITEVFTNPLTAGDPSVLKQYTELQLHFRNQSCSACQINFGSDNGILSVPVQWSSLSSIDPGWGAGLWGTFAWGNADGIDTIYETQANQIIRTYVPLQAQRSSYLMTQVIHSNAAESFDLQAVATTARPYSSRTTR